MNGDVRLLRRRWWGSWTLGGVALVSLCLVWWGALLPAPHREHAAIPSGVAGTVYVVPLLLVCYAPWTFFNVGKAVAFVLLLAFLAFLCRDLYRGGLVATVGDTHFAARAAGTMMLYGLPCMVVTLLHRPRTCPYDREGNPRPFEVDKTVCVRPLRQDSALGAEFGERPLPPLKFNQAGSCRLSVLDPGPAQRLGVTLPIGRYGETVWADWLRRMAEAGWYCEVVEEAPGHRSFPQAVIHSLTSRTWLGGRDHVDSAHV